MSDLVHAASSDAVPVADHGASIEPVFEQEWQGGGQRMYQFPNGYGASVISTPYSYGGHQGWWELAVVAFEPGGTIDDWDFVYDNPVTGSDAVRGWLNDAALHEALTMIRAFPQRELPELGTCENGSQVVTCTSPQAITTGEVTGDAAASTADR